MAVKRNKQDKEELRERIVGAATLAFTKSGVRNVRMDDIAVSLSISKRTLYELFRDKEQLLLEVMKSYWQEMSNYMAEVISRTENVLEIIFAFYMRKVDELCAINPAFLRDLRKYPLVLDFLVEKQKLSDEVAFRYFQKGMEQGIFRDDINFRIINEAMLMSMDLLIYSDIIEDYSLSEIYSEVTFLHIRGIATEKGMKMVDAFLEEIKKGKQPLSR